MNSIRFACLFFAGLCTIPAQAMYSPKTPLQGKHTHRRIPLLRQREKVESMPSASLCLFAQGILEQPVLTDQHIAHAKVLIDTAARHAQPAPLAFYLRGQTKKASDEGYIPAIYMRSIRTIEQLCTHGSPDNPIYQLLTILKKYQLPDETALPLLQAKVNPLTIKEPIEEITLQESIGTLKRIVSYYLQNPTDGIKPWVVRACYALSILQPTSSESLQHLFFAAESGFEPAVFELIKLRVHDNTILYNTLYEQYAPFARAARHLHITQHLYALTPDSIEGLVDDAVRCIDFCQTFKAYIDDIPLCTHALHSTIQVLSAIDETTCNYKVRCLRAIIKLGSRTQESIEQAFQLLEPIFKNKDMQAFLASHTHQLARKLLEDNAAADPQASFLLGLILCAKSSTRQAAYSYFKSGAEKNHFYSLISAANMIKNGFDKEKDMCDAVSYYKRALAVAHCQEAKKLVLAALKPLADSNCISAHCLYIIELLRDDGSAQHCNAILEQIELGPQDIFQKYIDHFDSYFLKNLSELAEQGNPLATRLLGYIHCAKAKKAQKEGIFDLYELHTSLGKLRGHTTTSYSRACTASLAFSLAQHYQILGNLTNALRLYTIASEYGSEEAPCLSALLRLKISNSSCSPDDLQYIEQLARQGNLEAQEFLVRLYSGAITCNKKVHIDRFLIIKCLENITAQEKVDPIYMVTLAKILCSPDKATAHIQDKQRAIALFLQAEQRGYQPTEEESRIFGILAFNLNSDTKAITLLEHCHPDKTVLWLLAILYLRQPAIDSIQFQKALDSLDTVLRIEKDVITVPVQYLHEGRTILKVLRNYLEKDNTHCTEIFLRLCYAYALDETIISAGDFLLLVSLLDHTRTLSAWNFKVFLLRKECNVYHSLEELCDSLGVFALNVTLSPSDPHYDEYKEQLILLAEPLSQRNSALMPLNKLRAAIKAAHIASILYCDTDLATSCLYFVLAEDAITTFFKPTDPIFDYAKTAASIKGIMKKTAEQLNATITIMIYRGYRHLRGHGTPQEIVSWLKKSSYTINQLETYKGGTNNAQDKLIAIFYALVSKLTLLTNPKNPNTAADCTRYFQKSLMLDPQLAMAKAYFCLLNIYNPHVSDKKRIQEIRILEELAKQRNPEACYILSKMYQPGESPSLPGSVQIAPNEEMAQAYLNQAACYDDSCLQAASAWNSWLPPCTIL